MHILVSQVKKTVEDQLKATGTGTSWFQLSELDSIWKLKPGINWNQLVLVPVALNWSTRVQLKTSWEVVNWIPVDSSWLPGFNFHIETSSLNWNQLVKYQVHYRSYQYQKDPVSIIPNALYTVKMVSVFNKTVRNLFPLSNNHSSLRNL